MSNLPHFWGSNCLHHNHPCLDNNCQSSICSNIRIHWTMKKKLFSQFIGQFFPLKFICWMTFWLIFLGSFTSQGVLSKDPSVWLNWYWPTNTCISPSFLGTCLHNCVEKPPQKVHLHAKKYTNFSKITYLFLKIWLRVWKTYSGNLPNIKYQCVHLSDKV
jgi:hypothetical protein